MGCFDANCCLTGLPLHDGDPIRAALLLPNQGVPTGCYPGGKYQFWTLPVESIYNDYGNLTWKKIPKDQKEVLEFILKFTLPALEDHEEYSRNTFDKGKSKFTAEKIWDICIHQEVDLDPNRPSRNAWKKWAEEGSDPAKRPVGYLSKTNIDTKGPVEFEPWMCHSWAWDHLRDIQAVEPIWRNLKEEVDQEIELFLKTSKMIEEESPGDDKLSWRLAMTEFRAINGEYGGIERNLRQVILYLEGKAHDEFVAILPTFKKMLKETVNTVANMIYLRKHLFPMTTVGEQYEQWEHYPAWISLIQDKMNETIKKREEDE